MSYVCSMPDLVVVDIWGTNVVGRKSRSGQPEVGVASMQIALVTGFGTEVRIIE